MKLPKSYIKKYGITKTAWSKYKASLKNPSKKSYKGKPRKTKRTTMARRYRKKKKTYRRRNRLAIAPTMGVAASFARQAPSGRSLIQDLMKGDAEGFLYDGREIFTGIDQNGGFHWDWVFQTYAPMFLGVLIHKAANALGVNTYMRQIPFLGKYIQV